MKKANIIFKDNTPFSLDFDDFYFNSKDGLNESKYIYSESFEFTQNDSFVIAELGFGIGLNFFLTLKRFLKATKRPKKLFYISIEGFYIEKDFLREIYKKLGFYDEFKEYLEEFLKFYPKCKEGYYRFYFKDCFLDLVFGNANILSDLEFKADVWYLDGFSPSKNKEMFDEKLVFNMSRLSNFKAQVCTFSASSFLRKNLENFGFETKKISGFRKREMLRAFFKGYLIKDKEAYFLKVDQKVKNKKVAIVGAGICAALLAYELSLRGFDISIFEKKSSLGLGASGNESGILSSLILKPNVSLGEFSQESFIEASRFYRQILNLSFNGVVEFAHNDLMKQRFISQKDNPLFAIKDNQAFLEDGGVIDPKEIVKELFIKSNAKIYFNHEFLNYEFDNELFSLSFKDAEKKDGFGILIYALGSDTKDFINYDGMNLSKVRGQVTHLKPILDIKYPLSSKGYICPIKNDIQVIGASYDRLDESLSSKNVDDKENIEKVSEFLKDTKKAVVVGSKVGFRSYSSDRFCIVGPAYDEQFYKANYKNLLWTKNKEQKTGKNIPNLYLNFAHGSRAFSTSILAARYICFLINEEPLGFFKRFISDIHPARFLIRKLKKGL
ncbi:bifunctional tRNA (5-methylaminomethyl-2-thiouridine)(34)-methyltransferase MnmD/FAD-dependent 5-carboxymethylaminomethyl-2-thiouridine(34) oxidoreductase MnmC [Campylobacter novaezeelandiae]|uniref:bifunctional tRNA (5-methylaminomethyl-2-thiouridine)(34)-methyltransferase MnmD/FAD-dependent 5-carboxymethylaminomethyl-2-thiouridine(34) oxidoreductase MnmC n=1 Tax=Campylobacter novaezeelandiae TaxID=2267891 RepID=UPI001907F3D1|nr:bifunctional tRNA (5-methylaminomethyl-2-thiouridine)(34)-methyltransferase MnmD/FAD-dependent 5-carboxymethylaminomethyl-2-thiouridine(34) oxidoreductase MnmC [Campylobacter novaezeelandiae]MBK1963727.1 bifunctional tRNA (5-methylaminomethyl-2-thiouridine)(34)-methyltransferase MnmD/FAD-dependent 5-carboxymethylaminomethyl-2-thiouridine(34) oxidoreductase MnmC [Campylobacter novaezeelandiae]MBK1993240.1 bifunctional tRNA (5-methylaminomethyl-2-thiouridine)(34)-methyltransferase MnmD/FAD-depen